MTEPLWRPHAPVPVGPPAPPRESRPVDVTVTVVLLVLLAPLVLVAMVGGVLTGMGISGCGGEEPCATVLGSGTVVMTVAPPLLWLVAAVWGIVRMVRGRPAWWLPAGAFLAWVVLAAVYLGLVSTLQP